jgi:hypothetical protein
MHAPTGVQPLRCPHTMWLFMRDGPQHVHVCEMSAQARQLSSGVMQCTEAPLMWEEAPLMWEE